MLREIKRDKNLTELNVRKLVMDTNCALYIGFMREMYVYHVWNADRAQRALDDLEGYLDVATRHCLNRTIRKILDSESTLESVGIEITYAFDGKQPKEKKPELDRRKTKMTNARTRMGELREEASRKPNVIALKKYFSLIPDAYPLTAKAFEMMHRYLISQNKRTLQCQAECDKECAHMCKKGNFDAVVSMDWDPLLFGCPVLIKELPSLACKVVYLDDVLCFLDLNLAELVAACIWSGVDYNHHEGLAGLKTNVRDLKLYRKVYDLNQMRGYMDISENILRWEKCKQIYGLNDSVISKPNFERNHDL